MRYILLSYFLVIQSLSAQTVIGGAGKIGGASIFKRAFTGGSVALATSYKSGSCNIVVDCDATSVVVNTGDTIMAWIHFCVGAGCASYGTCVVTIADTMATNTLSNIAGATTVDGGGVNWQARLYKKENATAGTYTIEASIAGCAGGDDFAFGTLMVAVFHGTACTPVEDTGITTKGDSASSASISLTSPGNIAVANEVGYGYEASQNTFSFSGGDFSAFLDSANSTVTTSTPTAGVPIVLSGTQSGGWYVTGMTAIRCP